MQEESGIPARLFDKHSAWQLDERGFVRGEIVLDIQHKRLGITDLGWERIVAVLGAHVHSTHGFGCKAAPQLARRLKLIYFPTVSMGHTFTVAAEQGRDPVPGDLWDGPKPLGQYIQSRMQANLFRRGVDYLVQDGKVVLLSQNTGRLLRDSRWSYGLHQASTCPENA